MKFSEICKKCGNKFVIEMNDERKPYFIGCIRHGIYKDMMGVSGYEHMKRVYAFSPENEEFVNPAKEFRFLIGDDMERQNPGSLTLKISEEEMFEMFVNGAVVFPCECPYYTEIAIEKWNSENN